MLFKHSQIGKKNISSITIIAVFITLVLAVFFILQKTIISQEICSQDIKLCSDGVTFVVRVAPNCEFEKCPTKKNMELAKFDFNLFRFLGLSKNDRGNVLNKLKEVNTEFVRVPLSWEGFEPAEGNYNFEYSDLTIIPLVQNGFKPLLICNDPPAWASDSVNLENEHISSRIPRDSGEYADFVSRLAGRYKDFEVAYEIWNEPDNPPYWGNVQSTPEDYMNLLKSAYVAIKEVDPSATVVAGAVLIQFFNKPDYSYLEGLLELGILEYCDVISVHIYPNEVPGVTDEFEETLDTVVRKVREYGDNEVWVTEISFFSQGFSENRLKSYLQERGLNQTQINEFMSTPLVSLFKPSKTVGEIKIKEQLMINQRDQIEKALAKYQMSIVDAETIFNDSAVDQSDTQKELMKKVFEKSFEHRIFWFQLYDVAFSQGLLNSDFSSKPAYEELKRIINLEGNNRQNTQD